ncbi:N-acetyltransferase [Bacillus sp. JCM 19041]|uniref:GNAT family N-acetyltransferase n=1 Tax=Bacillus sp. JCM 19041 TaxID=1460637 RepID=UPI000A4A77F3
MDWKIRETTHADKQMIYGVQQAAFGYDKEAILVMDLLKDETAQPLLSIMAFDGDQAVGHILFTNATLVSGSLEQPIISVLAPLAVIPSYQKQG